MKRFHFKYENILKLRLDVEDEVKKKLKRANAQLLDLENLLLSHEAAFRAYQVDIQLKIQAGIRGHELQQINGHQQYFRDLIENDQLEIELQERRIDKIKEELSEAMKERKIMEKLKEKATERFYEEMKVLENKETDEIVNFQNSKKSGD